MEDAGLWKSIRVAFGGIFLMIPTALAKPRWVLHISHRPGDGSSLYFIHQRGAKSDDQSGPNQVVKTNSPPEVIGAIRTPISGAPIIDKICTSHVERNNLNTRAFLRRMTSLCLGFSKKFENLRYACALYFA